MARSSKLRVMISSRCNDRFPTDSKTTLSEIRRELKAELEAAKLLGSGIFEVWINEDTPPQGGTWDSWDVCLKAVADCDVLLVLSNGNAGWSRAPGDIGICHAELMQGLATAPAKVRLISLGTVKSTAPDQAARDTIFQQYLDTQTLFRGGTVATLAELKSRVREALNDALIALCQRGVTEAGRGKFYSGAALDWSRLDFAGRRAAMEGALRAALKDRAKAVEVEGGVSALVGRTNVLFLPAAIPAALTIPSARELIGQPFLFDHRLASVLKAGKLVGPAHMIACHKSVTESQALRILGFPDATVVSAPFGVYVADEVQKIQMVLLANCRDATTTRHGVQRFFEWLEQTGEFELLATRALSRARIVSVVASESQQRPERNGSDQNGKAKRKRS